MAYETPELSGINIVLVGDLNPKIFQPSWFASHGLLRKTEAEEAEVDVIHSDITIFKLDWLAVKVTRERFDAGTAQEPFFEPLRDLIIGTFSLLEHTPIRMLGINYDAHYVIKDEEEWHRIGHALVPKEVWTNVIEKPGMRKLQVIGPRSDDSKGGLNITVEPSVKVRNGIYFSINDHYVVEDENATIGCSEILEIFKTSWDESTRRSQTIPAEVLNKI